MIGLLASISVLFIGDSFGSLPGSNTFADRSVHDGVNVSVFGSTTANWADPDFFYSNAGSVLEKSEFSVVHILLGTNDAAQNRPADVVQFNLLNIANYAFAAGVPVVVFSIQPHAYGVFEGRNDVLDTYAPKIIELWGIDGIEPGVDWMTTPGLNESSCLYDDLHPSDECHALAALFTDAAIAIAVPEPRARLSMAAVLVMIGLLERRRR